MAQEETSNVERLKELLRVAKNDTTKVNVLNALFKEYFQTDIAKAQIYAEEALTISEKDKYLKGIAESSENLGDVYQKQGAYGKSMDYYSKSLEVMRQTNNLSGVAEVYNHMGNIAVKQGDNPRAEEYYQDAIKIRQQIKDNNGIAITLTNLGSFHFKQENYDKAIQFHNQALTIADSLDNKNIYMYNLYRIAETYYKKGDMGQALKYFKQQLYAAQTSGDKSYMQKAYLGLSQVYARAEDYKKAYENYQYFAELKESSNKERSNLKIEQIQAEQKQTETELQLVSKERQIKEEEIQRKNLTQNFFIVSTLLILIITIIVFRNYQSSQRTNRLLAAQKEEIEKTSKTLQEKSQQIEKQNNAIKKTNETLEIAFSEIERKNKDITASINYAKRIQESMLPFDKTIKEHLPENFIIFKPRDIVSGDFYWFAEKQDKIILAAVDCTGHGIPGAFMSMVGNDYLNQIINLQNITEPDTILYELHKNIKKALKQEETENRDGMDVALCLIDKHKKTLEFAGAARPIVIVQDNQPIQEIMTGKLPIGGFQKETERMFEKITLDLSKETMIYIFSDGYQDQFGGSKGRKFGKNRLIELLQEIHHNDMSTQKHLLEQTLHDWMGDSRQMDDILIIGVRLKLIN